MRLAAAAVRVVGELGERALEVLEEEVKVDDLVDGDRLSRRDGLEIALGDHLLDFLDCAAGDREHHDEGHRALGARDLQVESLLLMTEDLDIAALEASSANRAVVEPGSIADELDDAHRGAHITPVTLALTFYAGAARRAHDRREI